MRDYSHHAHIARMEVCSAETCRHAENNLYTCIAETSCPLNCRCMFELDTPLTPPEMLALVHFPGILDGLSSHISRNNKFMQIQLNATRYQVATRSPQCMIPYSL